MRHKVVLDVLILVVAEPQRGGERSHVFLFVLVSAECVAHSSVYMPESAPPLGLVGWLVFAEALFTMLFTLYGSQ